MSKSVAIRGNLLPTAGSSEAVVEILLSMVSKYGVSIKTILDTDSLSLQAMDLQYFDAKWFGKIPTYPQFMRALKRVNPELADELKYCEADTLGGGYEQNMRKIVDTKTADFDGSEKERFRWNEKLYKIQERKIDRIDRLHRDESLEKGVDIAVRVISAMKDNELLNVKKVIKDVEWEEVKDDKQ